MIFEVSIRSELPFLDTLEADQVCAGSLWKSWFFETSTIRQVKVQYCRSHLLVLSSCNLYSENDELLQVPLCDDESLQQTQSFMQGHNRHFLQFWSCFEPSVSMCISEVLERSAGTDRGEVLPSATLWLARAAAFSTSQRLKAAVPELKVSDLVSVSPTDVLVTEGLCRQPPFSMHCLQTMPAGIKQVLLLLEALLVGDGGKYESLHLDAKDLQEMQSTATNQQGMPHYAQMLYVALAVLKLTTLIQPATATDKKDQNGLEAAKDLCWSLLDSLTQQLSDQRITQNPVIASDFEHPNENRLAPALIEILIPAMRQTVKSSCTCFVRACNLMAGLLSKSKPALAAMLVSKIVAEGGLVVLVAGVGWEWHQAVACFTTLLQLMQCEGLSTDQVSDIEDMLARMQGAVLWTLPPTIVDLLHVILHEGSNGLAFHAGLLAAAVKIFGRTWDHRIPQQSHKQLVFLRSVANCMNRLLEQQELTSSEAAATRMQLCLARSRSKLAAGFTTAEAGQHVDTDSDKASADIPAKAMQRLGIWGSSLLSHLCGYLVKPQEGIPQCATRDKSHDIPDAVEDADAVTISNSNAKHKECKGAIHELLPCWPTPTAAAFTDIQTAAQRGLVTLEWANAEAQRKLALVDSVFSSELKALKSELIILLHKLLLGHLQNDQLDMLSLVSLGLHSVAQAVFTFPVCVLEVNELCCAFALRFATDKRLIASEDEGIQALWSPGRAGLHALWTMLTTQQAQFGRIHLTLACTAAAVEALHAAATTAFHSSRILKFKDLVQSFHDLVISLGGSMGSQLTAGATLLHLCWGELRLKHSTDVPTSDAALGSNFKMMPRIKTLSLIVLAIIETMLVPLPWPMLVWLGLARALYRCSQLCVHDPSLAAEHGELLVQAVNRLLLLALEAPGFCVHHFPDQLVTICLPFMDALEKVTSAAKQGRSKLQSVVLAAFIFDSMPSRALLGYSDVGLPENVAWQAGMSRPVLITRTLAWLKTPEEQDYFAQHVFPICMAHFLRTTPSVVTCLAQPSEPLTTAQFVLPFIHVLGLVHNKGQATEAFSTAMLLLSGIVLKLVTPEHGLPQARFTEAWQKTTLSTVVWETDHLADTLRSMRLSPAWQPALVGSFGCFHEKPDEASLQMALHTLSLGQVMPAATILKVQDCFFPTPIPKSAKLIAKEQKAADLAAKQLIEEEQREQAKAAAKQARKQRKKAKQKLVVHEDLSEDQPQHSESLIHNLESDPDVDAASAAAPVQPNATLQTSADTGFADEHVASIKMKAKLAPDPAAPAEEPSVNRKSNPDMDFLNKLSCCHITQEVMQEPVIAADGHTYDRLAMEQWLQQHDTSPVTGSMLQHKRIVPNFIIKNVMAQQRQQMQN